MTRRYGKMIVVRAKADEHEAWTSAAARAGQAISEWVREACARLLASESARPKSPDSKPPRTPE